MLSNHFGSKVQLFGIEPNVEAVLYARSLLPDSTLIISDDVEFIKSDDVQKYDLCFVNAVFYMMAPARVRAVLTKMSSITNVIVIGDEIEQYDGDLVFDRNSMSFQHPFKTYFSGIGFQVDQIIYAPQPGKAITGWIVASRKDKHAN